MDRACNRSRLRPTRRNLPILTSGSWSTTGGAPAGRCRKRCPVGNLLAGRRNVTMGLDARPCGPSLSG